MRGRELRQLGERDAKAGKPIDAFYELPLRRHTEAARAEYEIGYRASRDETRYFVTIDGKRQYFSTLEDATKFASEYFTKHNVILGIERRR